METKNDLLVITVEFLLIPGGVICVLLLSYLYIKACIKYRTLFATDFISKEEDNKMKWAFLGLVICMILTVILSVMSQ